MSHQLESLGWTLVHFCWQAGVIALLYWLADIGLSKARSQTRYLLALGAMLLMFASAVATLGYEELQGRFEPPSSAGAALPDSNAAPGVRISFDFASLGGRNTAGAQAPQEFHLSRLLTWLDVAWLLGVACLSVRTIGGWRLIQRLRARSTIEAPEPVRASFTRLCQRLGITQQVSLRISDYVQGPLAMGIVRSLILLPASAVMALNPQQLEAVLAHELAHVRRADYFWNLIQTMIETLFFFHPAVWWLGRRLRQQRELCCDDLAVQSCADPVLYATALLRLEEHRSRQLHLAMALDGHRSGLRARIARILGETTREKGKRELAPLPLAAFCAALMVVLLPVPQLLAGLRTPATQARTIGPSITATTSSLPMELSATVAPHITSKISAPTAAHDTDRPAETPAAHNASFVAEGFVMRETEPQAPAPATSAHKADYIDEMRAAGYDVDVDKYVAMKVQDITPEYARDMAKAGFGKPSADDLIAMKVQGVTPGYVSELRAAGLEPSSFSDLISYRIFKVTPEFVAGMKAAGFDSIPPKKLVELRVQGITPEYAKTVKQQYPNATLDELVQLRIFHIDDAFLAAAKRHGFTSLSIQKLVQLRISGVLGDDETEAK